MLPPPTPCPFSQRKVRKTSHPPYIHTHIQVTTHCSSILGQRSNYNNLNHFLPLQGVTQRRNSMSRDGGGGQMHRQTLSQLLICSDPGCQPLRALCWQPLLKEPISALKLCTGFELDQTPELGHWPPRRLTVHSEQAPSPS